ncbi:MAG: TonB-dependent receptor [Chitinophagaceae bacterium]|nr:TonB-dependent receptor [Chitinophagaceae bacterium]
MPTIFRLFFLLLFSSFTLISIAQQQSILIKVVDARYNPVGFANISVVSKIDSTKITNTVTDSIGISKIILATKANLALKNTYTIKVSAIGYKKFSKDYLINDQSSIAIKLTEDPTQLSEVVVRSTKALIRQEDDKSVVDPEPLAASSTNAFETVEKVPGVFIDQDGNIYLNGLSPAGVQINGRDLRMSAADIAILLKSLPPNAIQKIELIRTPSAKYDASGGGGLVNIILMKGVKIGINGSVNTGFSQGEYGNQFIGFNLNNNNDKLSSYVNAQYSNNNGVTITNSDRILSIDSVLKQEARAVSPNHSANLGYGLGKTIKDKWELNYDGRMSQNKFDNTTNSNSFLRQISINQNTGNLQTYVNNKGTNSFMNQSFRVKLKLDTVGGEWVNDVSFNFSKSSTDQNYSNLLVARNTSSGGEGDFGNDRNFFTYQSDIRKKIRGINIESGVKTSILNFNNNSNYTKNIAGILSPDPFRTSKFNYKEQINAAYLQGSKTWGPVVLKVGSRLEQTIMQGHQFIPKDTTFSINRTDAFPYVYLSRKILMIMNYELRGFLVYRKTISRPSYDYLNPFAKYIDPFLYEVGNPNLKPQFTNNYEANISVDDKPLFAFGVNETNDIFTNVVYQSPTNKQVSYRTYDNLGKSRETYFRIIGVIPPGKKFFAVLGTQYNRNNYNGFYEGKPIMFNRGTWSVFTFQSFKLDGLSTITLNGFWRFKGQQQFYELSDFGTLNATINRQFLKKKLTITASYNDFLFTNKNNFVLNQGTQNAVGYRATDSRRVGLSLRYNFGIKPKENKMDMLDQAEKN